MSKITGERKQANPSEEKQESVPVHRIAKILGLYPGDSSIYEYAIIAFDEDPDAKAEMDRQFELAHRMYNELVAQSREIFTLITDKLISFDPDIKTIDDRIMALCSDRKEAKSAGNGERVIAITKEIFGLRREYIERVYEARRECKEDIDILRARLSATDSKSDVYAIRTTFVHQAGLYWATANAVMQAFAFAWAKQWPRHRKPNFRRAEERLRDSIVDQPSDRPGGIKQIELHSNKYRLWIEPIEPPGEASFAFRYGPGGRNIGGKIMFHRPLPEAQATIGPDKIERTITGARIIRKRHANEYRYVLQLQMAGMRGTGKASESPESAAGVSMGWYLDGDTRCIAGICPTVRPKDARLVRIPEKMFAHNERIQRFSSERDSNRNAICDFLKLHRIPEDVPEYVSDAVSRLLKLPSNSVSSKRLAGIVGAWETNGSATNTHVYQTLKTWRNADRKLWRNITFLHDRVKHIRRDFYRDLAAEWTKEFGTLIMLDVDLAKLGRLEDDETGEKTELNLKAREGRVLAGLSILHRCLRVAAERNGCRLVYLKAEATRCCHCGSLVPELSQHNKVRCHNCGEWLERRRNAAVNLRAAYDTMADEIEKATVAATEKREATVQKRKELKTIRSQRRSEAAKDRREKKLRSNAE